MSWHDELGDLIEREGFGMHTVHAKKNKVRISENTPNDVTALLRQCILELKNHNAEYQHVTPKEFIDQLQDAVDHPHSTDLDKILSLDCLNDYMREKIKEAAKDTVNNETYLRRRIAGLERSMAKALVGGCSCVTKTPEYKYHAWYCTYRILGEALEAGDGRVPVL
jgi:hypothetical protein